MKNKYAPFVPRKYICMGISETGRPTYEISTEYEDYKKSFYSDYARLADVPSDEEIEKYSCDFMVTI
jgi:hypothetical protein